MIPMKAFAGLAQSQSVYEVVYHRLNQANIAVRPATVGATQAPCWPPPPLSEANAWIAPVGPEIIGDDVMTIDYDQRIFAFEKIPAGAAIQAFVGLRSILRMTGNRRMRITTDFHHIRVDSNQKALPFGSGIWSASR